MWDPATNKSSKQIMTVESIQVRHFIPQNRTAEKLISRDPPIDDDDDGDNEDDGGRGHKWWLESNVGMVGTGESNRDIWGFLLMGLVWRQNHESCAGDHSLNPVPGLRSHHFQTPPNLFSPWQF